MACVMLVHIPFPVKKGVSFSTLWFAWYGRNLGIQVLKRNLVIPGIQTHFLSPARERDFNVLIFHEKEASKRCAQACFHSYTFFNLCCTWANIVGHCRRFFSPFTLPTVTGCRETSIPVCRVPEREHDELATVFRHHIRWPREFSEVANQLAGNITPFHKRRLQKPQKICMYN